MCQCELGIIQVRIQLGIQSLEKSSYQMKERIFSQPLPAVK